VPPPKTVLPKAIVREKIEKLPKTGLLFLGENKKTQTVREALKGRIFLSIDNSEGHIITLSQQMCRRAQDTQNK